MDTLHRLAGMKETVDPTSEPSQPVADLPPTQQEDDESEEAQNGTHRASRASLPLNRQPSHASFNSGKQKSRRSSRSRSRDRRGAAPMDDEPPPPLPSPNPQTMQPRTSHDSAHSNGEESSEEDYAWGPGHPCYPHPNPHSALGSGDAAATRVIRVRRDWLQAGDLYPQYANVYPEILDPLVTDEEFRFLVSNVNARLKAALDPFGMRAWIDAALGVVTGFLWDDLGCTRSKRDLRGLETFIDGWNAEREREGREVKMIQLRRTGFMSLDFVVPDPGIDTTPGAGNEGHFASEGGISAAE